MKTCGQLKNGGRKWTENDYVVKTKANNNTHNVITWYVVFNFKLKLQSYIASEIQLYVKWLVKTERSTCIGDAGSCHHHCSNLLLSQDLNCRRWEVQPVAVMTPLVHLWHCPTGGWWEPFQYLLYLKLISGRGHLAPLKCKITFQQPGLSPGPHGTGSLEPSTRLLTG